MIESCILILVKSWSKFQKAMHDRILYLNTGEVTSQADYLSSFIITYSSCWTCRKTDMYDFIFMNLILY